MNEIGEGLKLKLMEEETRFKVFLTSLDISIVIIIIDLYGSL